MIKAITFDYWNTLISDRDEYLRTNARIDYCYNVIKKYKEVSYKDVKGAFLETGKISASFWKNHYRTFSTEERLETILGILNVSIPEKEFIDIIDYFRNITLINLPHSVDNVDEIIPYLSKSYKLGVICDTGYSPGLILRKVLEKKKLLKYFSSLNFSNEVGFAKPHPKIFEKAANELNVKNDKIVHIGDIYRTDIEGALNCGFYAIHFIGENDKYADISEAKYIIKSLKEIPKIIESINKG